VVEVPAGRVLVSVLLDPLVVVPAVVVLVVSVPRPDEPPPAGVVFPLLELELPPPVEPEFEPPDVTTPPDVVELELFDAVLVDEVVCVETAAVLVGGTVKVGAPVVSVVPLPLPPQAASTSAATTAAPLATMARK
jgi:hypothetical protein